jgi:hypothetical protein
MGHLLKFAADGFCDASRYVHPQCAGRASAIGKRRREAKEAVMICAAF